MNLILKATFTALGIYSVLSSFQRAKNDELLLAGIELLCSIGFWWMSFNEREK
jgi:dolichyl-phosphate-mannose--protein O-mannosyl transferase